MQATQGLEDVPGEEARVLEWRRMQFRRLGFQHPEAELLAGAQYVDLGQVRRIVAAGCDKRLIFRIVL
jgi:hypothetical protein